MCMHACGTRSVFVMEGRRRLKRKSDENQMSERESRQSSVRARISRDREQQDETAAAGGPTTINHSPVEREAPRYTLALFLQKLHIRNSSPTYTALAQLVLYFYTPFL